jgi:hypothetical protein
MLNKRGGIFRSKVFRCVTLPCWTSVRVYLCPFRILIIWISARRIFTVLQLVLRFTFILFCPQISVRRQSGQTLLTLSRLHIEVLYLKDVALRYYNNLCMRENQQKHQLFIQFINYI